jgi:hypothetical protein
VSRRKSAVERLGLDVVAREAVEDDPLRGISLIEPVEQHLDGDGVGHELAALHVPARLEADRGAVADRTPEQVARGDVGDVEALSQDVRLGALAGSGRAEQDDDPHAVPGATAGIIG